MMKEEEKIEKKEEQKVQYNIDDIQVEFLLRQDLNYGGGIFRPGVKILERHIMMTTPHIKGSQIKRFI